MQGLHRKWKRRSLFLELWWHCSFLLYLQLCYLKQVAKFNSQIFAVATILIYVLAFKIIGVSLHTLH